MFPFHFCYGGKSGEELKQEPRGSAAPWLTPRGLLGLLSYSTQDHELRGSTAHSGRGPPTTIIHQDCTTDLPTGLAYGNISSIESPSTQIV